MNDTRKDASNNWPGVVNATAALLSTIVLLWATFIARDSAKTAAESAKISAKAIESSSIAYLAFDKKSNVVSIGESASNAASEWDVPRDLRGAATERLPSVRNFGPGPALNSTIQLRITAINGRPIDTPYEKFHPHPMNIMAGQDAECFILPSCIQKDTSKKIMYVRGTIIFECTQINGAISTSYQEVLINTHYDAPAPFLHILFDETK